MKKGWGADIEKEAFTLGAAKRAMGSFATP